LRDYRVPAEVVARMGVSVVRNQGSGSSQALPLLDS
jgi:hypothetical protein